MESNRAEDLLGRAQRLRALADQLESRAHALPEARKSAPQVVIDWVELVRRGSLSPEPRAVQAASTTEAAAAVLEALRGSDAAHASASRSEFGAGGDASVLTGVALARSLAWMAAGRPAETFEHLERIMFSDRSRASAQLALIGVFAESAHSVHRHDVARTAVVRLRERVQWIPTHPAHEELTLATALLRLGSDDVTVTGLIDDHAHLSPLHRARLNLGAGMWLRRNNRSAQSRPHLELSLAQFTGLTAAPWMTMLTSELRAAGSRRPPEKRGVASLSAHQRAIAGLAAAGLSNREIGERLFLSPRTVSSHFYRMFPKLGVTSRSQLAGRWRGWMIAELRANAEAGPMEPTDPV